jgi:hypothetical protein
MHSIRHHPASVGTQIRQFGRGATGQGSDQDAAHSGSDLRYLPALRAGRTKPLQAMTCSSGPVTCGTLGEMR